MGNLRSLFIVTFLMFIVFGTSSHAKAAMDFVDGKIADDEVEFLMGSSLEGYNFIEFSNPITKDYDGTTEVLLGYYEPIIEMNPDEVSPLDNYREYDRWYVYDQGITQSWSYLSNPYFIVSIARGMVYEKSTEVSATISGTFSSEIPNASLPAVKSSFGFNSSGSKKITHKITLSGPDAGYSSRDFYYKQGRHTHKVKIVQEHRSNWDGVLWTKTFYGSVGKPAIQHYSVDRR
ncbi:hypothetical protein P9B03_16955 [Metasolibacillus meyeri]|uniref:Uncharacterized protein n=1 Tax=Metasolibacillus meyeri TaxID=1071052 RepID=A0AAW9NW74_9BACL|nr:hypothetical protein [Metasolibacillus meyeri]MEC1180194.1 hypothetical protein [Metasolibacillus meyeri]